MTWHRLHQRHAGCVSALAGAADATASPKAPAVPAPALNNMRRDSSKSSRVIVLTSTPHLPENCSRADVGRGRQIGVGRSALSPMAPRSRTLNESQQNTARSFCSQVAVLYDKSSPPEHVRRITHEPGGGKIAPTTPEERSKGVEPPPRRAPTVVFQHFRIAVFSDFMTVDQVRGDCGDRRPALAG